MIKNLRIFVCEDEEYFLQDLERRIRTYLHKKEIKKSLPANFKFQIQSFRSGEELLKSDLNSIDLLFLDINLGGVDGIELAQIIQKRKPDIVLIFVSGYIQYAPFGYEVRAFRYLLKSQLKLTFEKTMYEALSKLDLFTPQLQLTQNMKEFIFYWNEILYVESRLHYMIFHFLKKNKTIKVNSNANGTLNNLEETLPVDTYIRIHQSYLVNTQYVNEIKESKVFLSDKGSLPISQRKIVDAKRKFFIYKGKY